MKTLDADGFTRVIEWTPAYNRGTEGGRHGMDLRFVLVDEKRELAIQLLVYTNWMLERDQQEHDDRQRSNDRFAHLLCHPMPADLGYHSRVARHEGQTPVGAPCAILESAVCYYDGSTLNAEPIYWRFVAEGEEAVWTALREYYNELIDMGDA